MKLTKNEWLHTGRWIGQWLIVICLMGMALGAVTNAQAVSTTTVQGTVYLANGRVGAGTLDVSWPAFTTSNSQAITAGRVTVTIGQDGFVSVNLAPNLGATPAGLYYTAIYHMSDGTTSTEYWVVPAAAQANLGQVRAQLMPSSQAVQAVSKAYVDQSITELTQSLLTATGGTLSGPLYLSGDPTQALQAADKHYVDSTFGLAVPLAGGSMTGALATPAVNGVQAPVAGSTQTTIQAAVSAAGTSGAVEIPPTYTGSDGFTNPNGVYVTDLRQKGAQQSERSVKEFGAVCDGTTDDTNALQAALNYALTHGVALTIPQGTCKTRMLSWRGESIGGMGKQVSALMGFPGQDVLATATDSTNLLANTRLHDLTIYVDQSMDVSCSAAEGRVQAGSCAMSRLMESNSIFSPGGNGLTGTVGTGTAWAVGNCAIAMPAATGTSGNGLRLAEIENLEIVATGTDPLAQYTGAHSTHTCGLYLAQWPQWSEFRNIDIRGLNTGIAMPALPGTTPAGLNADSNRWQNITIQATHGFTAAAGSNNVLDNVVVAAANSAATGETPTGLVLDLTGTQQGWTVRNAVVLPAWNVVAPMLTVTAAGGAVTAVTVGTEKGLGFDPYGTTVPLKFSGSCSAAALANVKSDGSIGTISVTQGGVGCSGTTTASVNVDGTWDTAAPVNLIAGQNMTLFGGNLHKGHGGYTMWNAAGSRSSGTMLGGGGGTLPGGGSYTGLVANSSLGSASQVDQFPGTDFGTKLQACLGSVSAMYGGTCDARNFTGNLSMASNLTISTANVTVLLPCATISTAAQVIVTAGTRNVALRGCALRGASTASGSQGGTVFLYSGTGAMVQVGDPTYAADTMGFHLDNVVINTTASSSATAQGLTAYRTQEMDLESLYFLGNQNQTGMTLDGTGNYTGGTFFDDAFNGFQTALNAIGHQASNAATTDWMNASAFIRLHIVCPTSAGSPISGTYGINLQQGDGNTFTGGDVENCSTALHLGANAQNNTIVGLRNENSTNQVVADAGSSYNNWMTGGTMFTGQLTDSGTRNSFMDTFHRSFNGIKGDWYGSQQDATVTNHYRIGIGTGNERGLLNRYQTDYGYRWTTGLSDATAGEQFFQVLDELNNVNRLSIGQYNNGQSSTNNQTVINAAGTGAIVLNGSNNAGTGGVIIGSGGASESTVATISNVGNAQFNGTLQVGGASTFTGSTTVKNQADAEIDQFLWAGTTKSQKEAFTYKDYNGSSQWYMVKDANNNWALNSATGGLDSFKAYQSGNSGDTYVNTSNSSGVIRLNYESGSSGKTYIYAGSSSSLIAAFSGTTAISFPGLAASSGHNCLQIDNSGYISNTGSACGTGSGGTNGTVSSGNAGQIAYYAASGTAVSGTSAVPITAGGTGATTAAGALASIGAQPAILGLTGDGQTTPGIQVAGTVAAGTMAATLGVTSPSVNGYKANGTGAVIRDAYDKIRESVSVKDFGAKGDGTSGTFVTTAGSNIVALANGYTFSAADAGKLISLPKVDSDGATLFTTITSYIDSSHVTVATTPSASYNGTGQYGYKAYWGTDDAAAINAALAWGQASVATPNGYVTDDGGSRIDFPCGIYMTSTEIDVIRNVNLSGRSKSCVWIKYSGASAISAAVNIQNGTSGMTGQIRELSIFGNKFAQYALRVMYPDSYHAEDIYLNDAVAGCFYTINGVQDTWSHLECNKQSYNSGTIPQRGLFFDSGSAGTGTIPTVVVSPWVTGVTGTALTLNVSGGFYITGCQISVSGQSLMIPGTSGGVQMDSCLLEGATSPDEIDGGESTFINTQFTGAGLHLTSTAKNNHFIGSTIATPLLIDAGALANVFDSSIIPGAVTVTDNSKDTSFRNIYDFSTGAQKANFPATQAATPNNGSWNDPVVEADGQWTSMAAGTPVNILTTGFVPNKAWKAIFIGNWIYSGTLPGFPTYLELTDLSNVVSGFNGGQTATFTLGASGKFQMTATDASIGFNGQIIMVPRLAIPGSGGTASMQLAGGLSVPSITGMSTPLSTGQGGTGNTTGAAVTANALAATPAQCASNNFSTGITVSGAANCAQPASTQLSDSANLARVTAANSFQAPATFYNPTATTGTTQVAIKMGAGDTTSSKLLQVTNNTNGALLNVFGDGSIDTYGVVSTESGGNQTIKFGGNAMQLGSAVLLQWSPNLAGWNSQDTSLYRCGAACLGLGSGGGSVASTGSFKVGTLQVGTTVSYLASFTGAFTAARTITLPDASGTVALTSQLSLTGTTGSIGGSALAAGQCSSGTVSIANSTTSMAVAATPVAYPGDGIYWRGYVSAAGTVTVKVCAAVAATPTASTYNVRVIQ